MLEDNPFAVLSPEDISAEDVHSLFVNVFTDFHAIKVPGHTFLHGHRGAGKSMMFRYLEPDCHGLALQKPLQDSPHFAVYIPVKKTGLKLTELSRLDDTHGKMPLNEHLLVLYVASRVFAALMKAPLGADEPVVAKALLALYQGPLSTLLQRSGYDEPLPNAEADAGPAEILRLGQQVVEDIYVQAQAYLRRLSFVTDPVPYHGPLCGFMDFLMPLLNAVRGLSFMPSGPIFIMIDDAGNLNRTKQNSLTLGLLGGPFWRSALRFQQNLTTKHTGPSINGQSTTPTTIPRSAIPLSTQLRRVLITPGSRRL